jgi:hypothetical protein
MIRHFELGKAQPEDRSVVLPSPLAGPPLLMDKMAIIPLENGLLYRLPLVPDRTIEAGPTWRSDKSGRQAVCYLAAVNETDFIASDGSKGLNRWRWSADEFSKVSTLTLSERVAAAPLVLPGGEIKRMLVADAKSNLTLWNLDRLGNSQPLRSWRPAANGPLPPGPVTAGPFVEQDDRGNIGVVYIVDGVHVVWLDPETDHPTWVAKRQQRLPGDGIIGRPYLKGNRLFLTDRTGMYGALDVKTGKRETEIARLRGAGPAVAGIPLDARTILAPLSDGTVLLRPMEPKGAQPPPVFFFPLPPLGIPLPLPIMMD